MRACVHNERINPGGLSILHKSYKLLTIMAFAGFAAAQTPAITPNGIVNVASYAYAGLPSGGIAPGSMFVAFGTNLGPVTLTQATAFPLGTTLGGTSVQISAGGKTFDAPLNYTSAGQVVGILPSAVPSGAATMTITYNGAKSAAQSFTVSENSFGTFAVNAAGTGPGAITSAAGAVFTSTAAANPGDAAVIYGTGLGAISGNDGDTPKPSDMTNIPVEVYVGSAKATVTYRGRSGCCAGLDQITFTVPSASGATGCSVPVVVKINNVVSNTTTMPIAPSGGRTCSDPSGPSTALLDSIKAKGTANIGIVTLTRVTTSISTPIQIPGFDPNFNADIGAATFSSLTTDQLNASVNPFNVQTVGACTVSWIRGGAAATAPIVPKTLDEGSSISVKGPNGSATLAKTAAAGQIVYGGTLGSAGASSNFLSAGSFTVSGNGGADVGAFSAVLPFPGAVTWTNKDSISSITRASGQTITWSGGDANTTILIGGSSVTGSSADSVGATFSCVARASDGSFTIPSQVLLALPPSVQVSGVDVSSLFVGAYTAPVTFTASGLDYGAVIGSVENVKTLGYK
jgi:uncharacterized protein (TIGR03437 family)